MRTSFSRIASAFLVCALLSTAALADARSKNVTFQTDVTVGDTLLKEGSYKVTFDEQTGELQLLKRGKVVARTTATLEEKATDSEKSLPAYGTVTAQDGARLLSRVDVGGRYAIVKNERLAAVMSQSNTQ